MRKILVIGAGRSSVTLIKFLLDHSNTHSWLVTVADSSIDLAERSVMNHANGVAIQFNVFDKQQREDEISAHDIVISMLPASMHIVVAKDCVRFCKHMVTASYVSDEMAKLHNSSKKSGVLILNEIGLDPGIDHMSAMRIIDNIKKMGGEIISFKSFCGGLVHPDYDNNPWKYKFTWNPRNVVLAGQGIAKYIYKGVNKNIPYINLFEHTEKINILDLGEFEGYPNRDSLSYRDSYGLYNISTLYRGTLRRVGFSAAWNILVKLGLTDDSYHITDSNKLTKRQFTSKFLKSSNLKLEDELCNQFNISRDSLIFKRLDWLGLFSNDIIGIKNATPAQILQEILEKKWSLDIDDRDMIVMQHQFEYIYDGETRKLKSSLSVYGDDNRETAMAKTVGLPVAIAAKLILDREIDSTGVRIPTKEDIYMPVLEELEVNGINFIEEEIS
jgi:saccharopine dehydrogenase (NADP+, L-glutamate forming)|tara:strand:+ start:11022 stop:12350 length:1329 start_codon:yes stop_codon:yes gene_type:complete